jgi:dTDP-4-dehydrorhamnose 3,5-epimerase
MPMRVSFSKTEIDGVLEVKVGVIHDGRGFFSEVYSKPVWGGQGFTEPFLQDNMSLSVKGALRGMHYQLEPYAMGKFVRTLTGSAFDVAVDLRRGSPTFAKWVGRVLSGENGLALWIPAGFAHGFVALEDNSVVYYKCTSVHVPESERALSYKDPTVAISWPIEPTVVSEKDAVAPFLAQAEYNFVYHA